eukprot:CAMPEP_0183299100 /NCGR_PEP_ID=MMETSP0160_2-20130417/5916_1 /TAXON_ID=2839 ORGANISM="Odontella Sinensis, Strain Grunow 1884" /NCGR_SAMPLE_ID=MMETSP0160_2 /ASSEMBLY_ACC=CAM_ASM_000250 /LENGTH=42 /DNA_ID= /DNA_START= /DNA_END= /DNA_ORIENTATION=
MALCVMLYPTPSPRCVTDIMEAMFPMDQRKPLVPPGIAILDR